MKEAARVRKELESVENYTADHSTYADLYYSEAFPEYNRVNLSIDRIPLMIYHKGGVTNYNNLDTIFTSSVDLYSTKRNVIRKLE